MALKSLKEINCEFEIERVMYYHEAPQEAAEPQAVAEAVLPVELQPTAPARPGGLTPAQAEWLHGQGPERLPAGVKKTRTVFGIVSDALFYLAIIAVIFAAATYGAHGAPRPVAGFSIFTVLTQSMQSELPKGSLILVHHVNPQQLKVGDDITYMRDATTSVTHKVINIYEDYAGSGARGFQTKGVDNADPDPDIVYAGNVVGRVIFHVPAAGFAIEYIVSHVYLVFIIFGLCIILSFSLRGLFGNTGKPAGRTKGKYVLSPAVMEQYRQWQEETRGV